MCDYQLRVIHVKKLNLLWKNLLVTHFKETLCEYKFEFPSVVELRTSEPHFVTQMEFNPHLTRLTYLYPTDTEDYIEDFLENMKSIPNLRYLRIDGTLRQTKSLGEIRLDHPKLTTFCIRSVDKADENIVITKDCVSLKDFELLCTNQKKLRIEAPNI